MAQSPEASLVVVVASVVVVVATVVVVVGDVDEVVLGVSDVDDSAGGVVVVSAVSPPHEAASSRTMTAGVNLRIRREASGQPARFNGI